MGLGKHTFYKKLQLKNMLGGREDRQRGWRDREIKRQSETEGRKRERESGWICTM